MTNKIKIETNQITLTYEDGKIEKFKPKSDAQVGVGTQYFDYSDLRYYLVLSDKKKN